MKLRRATQRLASAGFARALPGVVDDDDGELVPTLQIAQVREQRSHFAGDVLVDPMKPELPVIRIFMN